MRQDAPFNEQATLDQHRLELHQAPLSLLSYGALMGLLIAGVVLGAVMDSAALAAAGVLLAAAPLLWVLLPGGTRTTVACTGLRAEVRYWSRWGPLRRRARVPLAGLQVTVERRHPWKGDKYDHTITLQPPDGAAVRIERLLCTEAEAARVKAVLEGHTGSAQLRQGDGAAEIPAALRQLQGSSEAP